MFARTHKLFITALLVGCFVFSACENDEKAIPNFKDKRTALEEGKNIESYLSQSGKVKARLTAPLMLRYQADSPYIEFPKTLHVDFYDDSLRKESKLDARYGKYREWENKVFLKDSVVVINFIKGDTLFCDELYWDQNQQKFYTDKYVRINQKDKVIHGKGMEAAQNFSNWVIYQSYGTGTLPKDSL